MSKDNETNKEVRNESRCIPDVSKGSLDIEGYVQCSTRAQGVPEKVQDATVIGRLALMVKRPTRSSRKPDQTAKSSR
jgi:hypothetical protein